MTCQDAAAFTLKKDNAFTEPWTAMALRQTIELACQDPGSVPALGSELS